MFKKKNDVAREASPTQAAPQSRIVFEKIEDVASYLEQSKKMLMAYSLKNNIAVSDFSDGFIKMTVDETISSDFILNLQKILLEATGKNWKIDTARGTLGQTIAAKENAKAEENKKNVSEYPLVKAILSEFKGAKIETLNRKVDEEALDDEPQMPESPDVYFDDDL